MERLTASLRRSGGGATAPPTNGASRLNAMLDAEEQAGSHQEASPMVEDDPVAVAAGERDGGETGEQAVLRAFSTLPRLFITLLSFLSSTAEHEARVKAEGAAAHALSRLAVFQDQMGEWSAARDADAAGAAAGAAAALGAARAAAAAVAGTPAAPAADAAVAAASALADRLSATAKEAAAFAALAVADAERAKRSLSAANLSNGGGGGDGDGDSDGEAGGEGTKRARGGRTGGRRGAAAAGEEEGTAAPPHASTTSTPPPPPPASSAIGARARSIPLRLTPDERRTLALLTAALSVSQYTDKVDILSWRSKTGRVVAQIKEVCATLCGLVVASDFKAGKALLADRDFAALGPWFADVFEVGRRYKIACPEGETRGG